MDDGWTDICMHCISDVLIIIIMIMIMIMIMIIVAWGGHTPLAWLAAWLAAWLNPHWIGQ